MSSFDRIRSIESRIDQMEARLEGVNPLGNSQDRPNITSKRGPSHCGVSFESILNTLSNESRFRPTHPDSKPRLPSSGSKNQFDSLIRKASEKHGVEEALIRAVIKQESAYNPKATSHCGAMGLMQLMPDTAKELGCKNAYDPHDNIMAGTKYLRQLLDQFNGNQTLAIASYNAGPGSVSHYGGLPPFPETQDYVAKVLGNYRNYKGLGG